MKKLAVLVALLVVAAIACWAWSSNTPEVATESSTSNAEAPSNAASAVVAITSGPTAEATAQRTSALVQENASSQGPESILRGRCVDAAGRPLAGVEAFLSGWTANTERAAAWTKDHAMPEGIERKTTTGADGAFELRFWPPPPFAFSLSLDRAGLSPMRAQWSEITPGTTKDLGDIPMQVGTLLIGRVLEGQQTYGGALQLHVQGQERFVSSRLEPVAGTDAEVDRRDGSFRCRSLLSPGAYTFDVPHRTVVSPKQIVLDGSVAELAVDVVLEPLDDSKAIRGIVTDEQGAPIRGVHVDRDPRPSGQHWTAATDREGRFRLPRTEKDTADAVKLSFSHEDYERQQGTEPVAWGRADVRATLVRRSSVDVLVVAEDGGEPIEDFELRVLWPGDSTDNSSLDLEVRGGSHHEGGRVALRGITRGRHLLFVEPRDEALAVGSLEIEAPVPSTAPLVIRIPRKARRELRVQRADGTPVASAAVQLADATMLAPPNRQIASSPEFVHVANAREWTWNAQICAREVQTGTTDEQGRLVLRGRGDRDLLLRLPGPPNTPLHLGAVRLDVADPLVVTVNMGARLDGKVTPSEAVVELFRAGRDEEARTGDRSADALPRIALFGANNTRFPPHERPALVAPDGSFTVDGVPPGTWTVDLVWSVWTGTGIRPTWQRVGEVTLQDGATTTFDLDAPFAIPGELEGMVLHNGAPLTNATVSLEAQFGKDMHDMRHAIGWQVKTDAGGRFAARVRAGDFLAVWREREGRPLFRSTDRATVVSGRTTTHTFHLETGTVRVRLLDATGAAAARVTFYLHDAADGRWIDPPATDPDGRSEIDAEAGTYALRVLPKRLQDPTAQQQLWQNRIGNADPREPLWITLGTVAISAANVAELEVRLPADW